MGCISPGTTSISFDCESDEGWSSCCRFTAWFSLASVSADEGLQTIAKRRPVRRSQRHAIFYGGMRVDNITQLQTSVIPQRATFLRHYQAKTANKDKSNGNPGLGKGTREVSFGFWWEYQMKIFLLWAEDASFVNQCLPAFWSNGSVFLIGTRCCIEDIGS